MTKARSSRHGVASCRGSLVDGRPGKAPRWLCTVCRGRTPNTPSTHERERSPPITPQAHRTDSTEEHKTSAAMARCSCVLTGTGVTGTLTLSQPSEVMSMISRSMYFTLLL